MISLCGEGTGGAVVGGALLGGDDIGGGEGTLGGVDKQRQPLLCIWDAPCFVSVMSANAGFKHDPIVIS